MTSIVVKHNMLSSKLLGIGGSEYVALETVIGLSKKGFNACLKTVFPVRSKNLVEKAVSFYGVPREDLEYLKINNCVKPDISINSTGDFLSGSAQIIYFHYPSILKPETYYSNLHGYVKLSANIYYLFNKLLMYRAVNRSKLLLANSTKTARYVAEALSREVHVLYPPVNINRDKPLPRSDRESVILVVSRISYEKQPYRVLWLLKILDTLDLRDWRIVFTGSRSIYSDKIIREILGWAERRGYHGQLVIKTMISREELNKLYRYSYIYVHLTGREHFGISVVEAMSHGTPVVIPVDSGAWIDVAAGRRDYALPYRGFKDLLENIKLLIEKPELWNWLSVKSYQRSMFFSRERYHEEIVKYVEEAIGY